MTFVSPFVYIFPHLSRKKNIFIVASRLKSTFQETTSSDPVVWLRKVKDIMSV